MRRLCSFVISILFLSLFACKKHKENKIEPDKEFVSYINTDSIQTDLVPLDIVKTPDEGFLILGSSPSATLFHKTYLLKINKEGKYEWDNYLDDDFLNPVSDILTRNGEYYVFCMDEATGTHLVKLNASGGRGESAKYWGNILLPLHANFSPDGGYLILSANVGDKYTLFTKVGSSMNTVWSIRHTYDDDYISASIDRHVKKESTPLPFFCGTAMNGTSIVSYYFNAFKGANFSCYFVDPVTGRTGGSYTYLGGDRAYAAVRSLLQLDASTFALSWYDRSSIDFLTPRREINIRVGTPTAVTELGGQKFADMEVNSRIVSKRLTIAGRDVLIYAANTKNKGIGLYAFDANSGGYLNSKNLSLETPLEMGGIVATSDGGLTIMAKTYVANRFARVCLLKLSEDDLKPLVGM